MSLSHKLLRITTPGMGAYSTFLRLGRARSYFALDCPLTTPESSQPNGLAELKAINEHLLSRTILVRTSNLNGEALHSFYYSRYRRS